MDSAMNYVMVLTHLQNGVCGPRTFTPICTHADTHASTSTCSLKKLFPHLKQKAEIGKHKSTLVKYNKIYNIN